MTSVKESENNWQILPCKRFSPGTRRSSHESHVTLLWHHRHKCNAKYLTVVSLLGANVLKCPLQLGGVAEQERRIQRTKASGNFLQCLLLPSYAFSQGGQSLSRITCCHSGTFPGPKGQEWELECFAGSRTR